MARVDRTTRAALRTAIAAWPGRPLARQRRRRRHRLRHRSDPRPAGMTPPQRSTARWSAQAPTMLIRSRRLRLRRRVARRLSALQARRRARRPRRLRGTQVPRPRPLGLDRGSRPPSENALRTQRGGHRVREYIAWRPREDIQVRARQERPLRDTTQARHRHCGERAAQRHRSRRRNGSVARGGSAAERGGASPERRQDWQRRSRPGSHVSEAGIAMGGDSGMQVEGAGEAMGGAMTQAHRSPNCRTGHRGAPRGEKRERARKTCVLRSHLGSSARLRN